MANKCHLGKNAYTTLNIIATSLFYLLLRVVIVERQVLSAGKYFFVQNFEVKNLETRKRIHPAFCRNPCSSAVTEFRIAIFINI